MFHETLHYFLGFHGERPEADEGIMNNKADTPTYFLYRRGTWDLTARQILAIQAQPKPKQNG